MPSVCYGIDGRSYNPPTRYISCNGTAIALGKHSSCCALGDVCLSNGLCQSQSDFDRKANTYWRNGCTDSTWNDSACPKVCAGMDDPDTHAVLACPIASTAYCCPPTTVRLGAATNTACCGVSSLAFTAAAPVSYTNADLKVISIFYITPPALTVTTTPIITVTSPVVTVTTTPSLSSARASSSAPVPVVIDKQLARNVGGPLGAAIAVALTVIACLLCALCSRRKKVKQEKGDEHSLVPPQYAERGIMFAEEDEVGRGRRVD